MALKVGGIVLCGGESRRMGQPKAWLPFGDEVLLQRIVRILREVVSPIVVVAAPDQHVPQLGNSADLVRDAHKGRGPLEGLAAGLRRIAELGADAAYASATDAPFLQANFVRRVVESLGDATIAVPYVENRHHPLAAVYRTTTLAAIEHLLTADRLRPFFLFESVPTRVVEAAALHDADPEFKSLRNLNTPEEYSAALQDLAIQPCGGR